MGNPFTITPNCTAPITSTLSALQKPNSNILKVSNTLTSPLEVIKEHPTLTKMTLIAAGAFQIKSMYDNLKQGDVLNAATNAATLGITCLAYKGIDALRENDAAQQVHDLEVRLKGLRDDDLINKKFKDVTGHTPTSPEAFAFSDTPLSNRQVCAIQFHGNSDEEKIAHAINNTMAKNPNLSRDECLKIRTLITCMNYGVSDFILPKDAFDKDPAHYHSLLGSLCINENELAAVTTAIMKTLKVNDAALPYPSTEDLEQRLAQLKSS
ncbi:hypothetical protein [Pseudomonas entomophila]|uniref:hypothetical protein n=1 Tax=Pseudomonas entomophila TaxID=312306 RepID=UPI001F0214D4|nr:hypothetical protein [Pseudomonas entomophila]MCG8291469.1 hypothetical protein [Pseudomonas entomophila]